MIFVRPNHPLNEYFWLFMVMLFCTINFMVLQEYKDI